MSNAAPWAVTAANKFREVARSSENPTTKLLAEGLTALAEAIRELDGRLEKVLMPEAFEHGRPLNAFATAGGFFLSFILAA